MLKLTKQQQALVDDRATRKTKNDSWYNSRNRMGTSADNVIISNFVRTRNRIKREDAEVLYEQEWLSARVVDQLAKDATREWITFSHPTSPEKAEKLREEDRRLGGRSLFENSIRWARLHGGAILVIGAWDGNDPEQPLNVEGVRNIMFTTVVDRWLAYPRDWYRDGEDANFGKPETYQIHRLTPVGTGVATVHETRTIRFEGDPLPAVARTRNWGWGASVLDKVYDALRNWGISNQAAASIIPSYVTTAMQISNLTDLISNNNWESIQMRLGEIHAQMATHNLVFYGGDEKIERIGTPATGLDTLMDKFMEMVSGAVNIPKSILFQAESGALGGTAAGTDVRNWYANVGAHQENDLRLKIRRWLDIIGVPLGLKPGEVDFEFKPLWQLTEAEEADVYLKTMQADQTAINTGMVDIPERLGVLRFGGATFNGAPPVFNTKRMEEIIEEVEKMPIEPEPEEEGNDEEPESPKDKEDKAVKHKNKNKKKKKKRG